MKKTICLDFDGVINSYSKWTGYDDIPDPIVEGAKGFIDEAKKKYKICIFTTRAKTENGKLAVREYLKKNGIEASDLEITATKPPAIVYIDDRAICFKGTFVGLLEKIDSFKPWNRELMKEVTIKNYQELAMRTCLPSAKNWEYCYCLITSEIGEAFGKWGKLFRDGKFDKDKLADELGDVFWGLALACELAERKFEDIWNVCKNRTVVSLVVFSPSTLCENAEALRMLDLIMVMEFAKTFSEQCGIDPLDCLRRNIAKLAGRKERGTLTGNGDER